MRPATSGCGRRVGRFPASPSIRPGHLRFLTQPEPYPERRRVIDRPTGCACRAWGTSALPPALRKDERPSGARRSRGEGTGRSGASRRVESRRVLRTRGPIATGLAGGNPPTRAGWEVEGDPSRLSVHDSRGLLPCRRRPGTGSIRRVASLWVSTPRGSRAGRSVGCRRGVVGRTAGVTGSFRTPRSPSRRTGG